MADEQIDFEDEEYGGYQKIPYHGSGAIPALAEEEMGDDDEYDDLYNDVNVGENFKLMHQSEQPTQQPSVGNAGFQPHITVDSKVESNSTPNVVAVDGKYSMHHSAQQQEAPPAAKEQEIGTVGYSDGFPTAQRGRTIDMNHDAQVRFQRSAPMTPNIVTDSSDVIRRDVNDPVSLPNVVDGNHRGVLQTPVNQISMTADAIIPIMNENQTRPANVENGSTMLFVGELHWWTTDAEIESVCSRYGRVKEVKFFDERASGKSKGYCQVEFYESASAVSCKEGMSGHSFNGRSCVVAFASPQTLKQMGASYASKAQNQGQSQNQGRRPANDNGNRGNNANYQGGEAGRNYGRGNWPRGGQGAVNRGPGGVGSMRGRGAMGGKNMVGNASGVGMGANGGVYGQGMGGPGFGGPTGGMMPPQGMMGAGFDPTYMGRGAGYAGFGGPGFPGMLPTFPAMNTMGLGVAPHVNPAFFGRGMAPNGIGMMGSGGMDMPNAGMWSESGMGGWGEEHGRRTRESSYVGDDGASEYGYGEVSHEKGARSTGGSREKERSAERDWSGNSDRRQREEREQEWDRPERDHREHRHREDKDSHREHRQRDRDSGYDDDRDRGQSSSRSRNRSRAGPEDDLRSRSRDADYAKRRRPPSE